jgi:lipopolysaccharide/colanic/teichoic acid biosynthesis glycosyltransferase
MQNSNSGGIYRRHIKRLMDFILSILAIVILSPLFLILAILIRYKLGSPVIFKQKRPGLNEEIFEMYKFRTMTDSRDANGELLPDNERLTKLGRWLRSNSLDELPELFNILMGSMSFVGPRPLFTNYLPHYSNKEKLRHTVRPGLTGWAQVNGRNFLAWDQRLEKDVEYVLKLHFMFDLKIIYMTLMNVVSKKDIAVDTNLVEGNLAEERKARKNSGGIENEYTGT